MRNYTIALMFCILSVGYVNKSGDINRRYMENLDFYHCKNIVNIERINERSGTLVHLIGHGLTFHPEEKYDRIKILYDDESLSNVRDNNRHIAIHPDSVTGLLAREGLLHVRLSGWLVRGEGNCSFPESGNVAFLIDKMLSIN